MRRQIYFLDSIPFISPPHLSFSFTSLAHTMASASIKGPKDRENLYTAEDILVEEEEEEEEMQLVVY